MSAVQDAMCFTPEWPVPPNVHALITTRTGGASTGAFATLNLGTHVGDAPQSVAANRALVRAHLPAEPVWMHQVHGIDVIDASAPYSGLPTADGAVARRPNVVCAVMTADCLPVLLAHESGSVVGIVHAGWRGLAQGVIESTLRAMSAAPVSLLAYLGPAIGPRAYEVGAEVRDAFVSRDAGAAQAFVTKQNGKYWCDLYGLARRRLVRAGVERVFGGQACTFTERERYFSFRRDGTTGRMASCIWIAP